MKGTFETCLNSDYVSAYQSKKITLLKMKRDANIGKETVTKENKEAPKKHIEAMLTKKDKAKLLMQRKQLNADKDEKENRETELGDSKKTKKTQTQIKASKLKRKTSGRVVKRKKSKG